MEFDKIKLEVKKNIINYVNTINYIDTKVIDSKKSVVMYSGHNKTLYKKRTHDGSYDLYIDSKEVNLQSPTKYTLSDMSADNISNKIISDLNLKLNNTMRSLGLYSNYIHDNNLNIQYDPNIKVVTETPKYGYSIWGDGSECKTFKIPPYDNNIEPKHILAKILLASTVVCVNGMIGFANTVIINKKLASVLDESDPKLTIVKKQLSEYTELFARYGNLTIYVDHTLSDDDTLITVFKGDVRQEYRLNLVINPDIEIDANGNVNVYYKLSCDNECIHNNYFTFYVNLP